MVAFPVPPTHNERNNCKIGIHRHSWNITLQLVGEVLEPQKGANFVTT